VTIIKNFGGSRSGRYRRGRRPHKHLSDSERWFLAKHSDFCTLLYLEISTLGAA
jgi:hypothetical protein